MEMCFIEPEFPVDFNENVADFLRRLGSVDMQKGKKEKVSSRHTALTWANFFAPPKKGVTMDTKTSVTEIRTEVTEDPYHPISPDIYGRTSDNPIPNNAPCSCETTHP